MTKSKPTQTERRASATLRVQQPGPLPGYRAPSYNPRELPVLRSADRVIARLCVQGKWHEQTFLPEPGEGNSVRAVALRVIAALRHTPDSRGIVLYVEGLGGDGTRARACIPQDPLLLPGELK